MPFAYPNQAALKQRIVARVAGGETVKAICAEAEMPDKASIQVWRRADPAFAGALAEARQRAFFHRRMVFDEAVAAAFLARVAAREGVNTLLDQPGMPSQRTYIYWRRTQPAFAEELWRLRRARYEGQSGRGHGRWRDYDPAVADKLLARAWKGEGLRAILRSDAMFPSLMVLARWRRQQPEFDKTLKGIMKAARTGGRKGGWLYSEALGEAIIDGILTGGSLRSLAERPDMPCANTLYAWVRKRPEFAAEVARACEWRRDWYIDQMMMRVEDAGSMTARARQALVADLSQQLGRLEKRPGWKRRRGA